MREYDSVHVCVSECMAVCLWVCVFVCVCIIRIKAHVGWSFVLNCLVDKTAPSAATIGH